ncbi:MAG: CoA transferase [Casimicrobiaceae bacterium]
MAAAEVPTSKIYDIRDIVADAHYQARGMLREIRLEDGATLKVPGAVPKLSSTSGNFTGDGAVLGAHTDEILHDLSYDKARILELRMRGIIHLQAKMARDYRGNPSGRPRSGVTGANTSPRQFRCPRAPSRRQSSDSAPPR